MCPLCIANAAVLLAGAGSTGGILAACASKSKHGVQKFRNLFQAHGLSLPQNSASKNTASKK
jgi:hypothetical protein